jgi:hypothetical protein
VISIVAGSGLVTVMVALDFLPVTAVVSAVMEGVACWSCASQVNAAVNVIGSAGVPSMVAVVKLSGMGSFLSAAFVQRFDLLCVRQKQRHNN